MASAVGVSPSQATASRASRSISSSSSYSTGYAPASRDATLEAGNIDVQEASHFRRMNIPRRRSSFARSVLFHPHEPASSRVRPESLVTPNAFEPHSFLDTPSAVRADTVQLSSMLLSSTPPTRDRSMTFHAPPRPERGHVPLRIYTSLPSPIPATSALPAVDTESRAGSTETSRSSSRGFGISPERMISSTELASVLEDSPEEQQRTPIFRRRSRDDHDIPSESAPLLSPSRHMSYTGPTPPTKSKLDLKPKPKPRLLTRLFSFSPKRLPIPTLDEALHALPAVVLGLLLNILDGVSYGMIIFPAAGIFAGFGGTGVSMFFVTAIIAQLVYSCGGSGFTGANGSMMIEVVPFFHILAGKITAHVGEDDPQAVIATTIASFALSSILTGITFFTLGYLNLGMIIGFFPRHILVGCIGGVGVFLMETGFEIAAGLESESFSYDLPTLKLLFLDGHNLVRWLLAFVLAIGLKLVTRRWDHQLVFPLYCLSIPVVFYIVVAIAQLDTQTLRHDGWLFNMGGVSEPWYHFYAYFDFGKTSFGALWATLPTQFALLFFNTLHPPLNVPALSVSLDQDVDTNRELVAHGYSNLLAGFTGSVPNYLAYVNTLMFYRVGRGTRFAGFLLAGCTAMLLLMGTAPIEYIPIMVVGALIFVLGMDLIKEAVWDTRHRVSRTEYITIVSIMVCMTLWDFVIGVLFGIVVSCVFFVVQNSRSSSIRALYTGDSAISTVRRPGAHRTYIREVAKQTVVMRLQGHLFFGTITHVEARIRQLLEASSWQRSPVRFLIVDLSLVAGVDLSSAEAFVRVQRLLVGRSVTLVLCGFSVDSDVGKALENVDLFREDGVEIFAYLNEALEWTENAYLKAWLSLQKSGDGLRDKYITFPGRQHMPIQWAESSENTLRRSQLRDAGRRIFVSDVPSNAKDPLHGEPYETLLKAFSSYGPLDPSVYRPLMPHFTRVTATQGEVLWKQGEPSDALYLVQSGVLRASYQFAASPGIDESMVAGTLAGELSAVSGTSRNATTVVERDAVLWKLDMDDLKKLEEEEPALARAFMRLILKSSKVNYDILIAALAAGQ